MQHEINQSQSTIMQVNNNKNLMAWKTILVVLLLLQLTFAAVRVRKGRIVDEKGAELIFHGLNLVSKEPPYHTTFNQTDMQFFQSRGINGIRLGVMWPGVEPSRGQFDQAYLGRMLKTVQDAGKYGIYTLVQFHQDLFSKKFCADGVPVWAIPDKISHGFPRPVNIKSFQFNQTGYPHQQDCDKHPWSQFYVSNSVNKAFGSIWSNRHGMRDLFIKYWRKVAETFKGNEYVIAYELMNEPWPGDLFRNPLVMVPGLSEAINLQPAYDIISKQIRKIDPDHSICFEPVTYLNYFRSGFSHPPGGRRYANSSIFCYHYYNPPTFNLKKFMKARQGDIKRLKTGGLLSEFYVINAEGQKNIAMMDECDANLQSWFGWIYPISQRGLPRQLQSQHNIHEILYSSDDLSSKLIEGITRTYAPRVAGETISQHYDAVSKRFTLSYYICKQCGDTLIFVSESLIYTEGYDINCYPVGGVSWEKQGEYLIKVVGNNIQQGANVLVVVSAF